MRNLTFRFGLDGLRVSSPSFSLWIADYALDVSRIGFWRGISCSWGKPKNAGEMRPHGFRFEVDFLDLERARI